MSRLGSIDSQYFTAAGEPLQGGLLYFYETGTTTPKTTYIDNTSTLQNSWPIVLDAAGVPPPIFFTGTAKIVLKDKDGNTLRTLDPVIASSYTLGDPLDYRLGSIDSQLFDQNGKPLPFGKLYVYENGTSTPKTTYGADDSINSWPVVFDETGFWGDIFFTGKARLVLKDQYGVQIRTLDDVETLEVVQVNGGPGGGGGDVDLIANCPDSLTVIDGQDATFTVELVGAVEDYTIAWYKNLVLQAGETGVSFTVTGATDADNGSQILVAVTDDTGIQLCGQSTLTVVAQNPSGPTDTCTNLIPISAEGTLTTIWEGASVAADVSLAVRTLISGNGLLAVNGNTIYQVVQTSTTTTAPNSLKFSTDFGANWSDAVNPYSDVGKAQLGASYDSSTYPNSFYRCIRFIGNSLYVNFMGDTRYASISSTTDGTNWTLQVGSNRQVTDASNSWGSRAVFTEYSYHFNESASGEVLLGGRAGSTDYRVGYTVGPWNNETTGFSGVVNPDNNIIYGGSNAAYYSNCTHIVDIGGTVYQSGSGATYIWAGIAGTRKVSTITYSGISWGGTFTGSYYETGGFNAYRITGLDISQYGWQSDGTNLLIPKTDKDTHADVNEGLYTHISGLVATDIDYSSLIVKGDAGNEGDLYAFNVYYIKAANKWVMVYAFDGPGGSVPDYFYMRVAGTSHQVSAFGTAKKINMPTGYDLRPGEGDGGPFAIDYSTTQDKWVFSGFGFDGSIYRQIAAVIENDFQCP